MISIPFKSLLYTLIISPVAYSKSLSSDNLGDVPLSFPVKIIFFFSVPSALLIWIANAVSSNLSLDNLSFVWLYTLYLLVIVSKPISNAGVLFLFSSYCQGLFCVEELLSELELLEPVFSEFSLPEFKLESPVLPVLKFEFGGVVTSGLVLPIELLLSPFPPGLMSPCSLLIWGYILNTFLYKLGLTVTFLSTVVVFPQRSVAV